MHELSVAKEIIAIVEDEMAQRKLRRIDTVSVRIGALTGVNAEALTFGFIASVAETLLEGAQLVIEEVPVICRCCACGKRFETEGFVFICPACGSIDTEVVQGEELDIDHLVGE